MKAAARPLPPVPPLARPVEDPLAPDARGDVVVVTTRRALCRVASVAAEVGSRFQREGIDADAVAWMLAPRSLFGGAAALDACLGRDAFARATLLHGLSLGLDAAPDEIDALVAGRPRPGRAFGADGARGFSEAVGDPVVRPGSVGGEDCAPARLRTALLWTRDGEGYRHAFHASVASSADAFGERVRDAFGDAARLAVVQEGVDVASPVVAALVGPIMLDRLGEAERDPGSPALVGLSLTVDLRMGA